MICYRIDRNGYMDGVDEFDICPDGWVSAPMPPLSEGDYALWDGTKWVVTQDCTTVVEDAKAKAVVLTKAEANARIVTIAPEWKQRNMTARAVQLVRRANPTVGEIAEMDAIELFFTNTVEPIRIASNLIEAEIMAAVDADVVLQIDIKNHGAWPV